jgi:hypothetical protein
MDRAGMEQIAEEHGQKVVRGDMDAVVADIAEELHPHVPEVAGLLPQPTTEANVLNVDVQGSQAICEILYAGDEKSVTPA